MNTSVEISVLHGPWSMWESNLRRTESSWGNTFALIRFMTCSICSIFCFSGFVKSSMYFSWGNYLLWNCTTLTWVMEVLKVSLSLTFVFMSFIFIRNKWETISGRYYHSALLPSLSVALTNWNGMSATKRSGLPTFEDVSITSWSFCRTYLSLPTKVHDKIIIFHALNNSTSSSNQLKSASASRNDVKFEAPNCSCFFLLWTVSRLLYIWDIYRPQTSGEDVLHRVYYWTLNLLETICIYKTSLESMCSSFLLCLNTTHRCRMEIAKFRPTDDRMFVRHIFRRKPYFSLRFVFHDVEERYICALSWE